ncbi:MAG: flagellar biosynthesis protein FlhA [Firmicutes bacterium]|nr:flagellar biosynthesis protein FlhA [Bacillota bacterium]MBO2520336.1 flagellar biosynthesis protein FlhA [Bacillota bacterium]
MAVKGSAQGAIFKIGEYSDLLVFLAVILVVVMMVLPMPPLLLDLLLALNISLALLVLLLTMNIQGALQFSIFPSLLLITTLFRLALNVSSTRLILLQGYAGEIIRAFGNFVVGGNYVVGFVVFLILVVIQFIVITKGAERVAEVAARFTLDAMPGKQMSIDADLNAGLIDEKEARRRRAEIEREADFYGAMDGASKFVKGDAIAGLVITAINIIGGFAVGVGQRGMGLGEALQHYTLLTVGDGLVTQIPALLIATATGIIITRAASEANMGRDVSHQLLSEPRVLAIAAGVLVLFAVVPGLPTVPFLVLSLLFGLLGYASSRRHQERQVQEMEKEAQREAEEAKKPERVSALLKLDAIELEIGYSLIPLVDANQGGDLLDRITMIRRQIAIELGLVVPPIRIRDNMQLGPNAYVIKIKGIEVGRGELMPGHYLAMESGPVSKRVSGIETREPAFGLPALWIPEEAKEEAELAGYTVVDSPSIIATHLTEIIRSNAAELLGRQDVKKLLDELKEDHAALVDEVVPELLTVGEVQRVLQNLLREGVPIRDLVTILETLGDFARATKDQIFLTEKVREALARQISKQYTNDQGYIPVITLDPAWEQEIADALQHTDRGLTIALAPERVEAFYDGLSRAVERAAAAGHQAVVLCSPVIRAAVRKLVARVLPRLAVISYNEVAPNAQVQSVGMVSLEGHAS